MAITHSRDHKKKKTGGKRVAIRKKRDYELGRPFSKTRVDEKNEVSEINIRGTGKKLRLKLANAALVSMKDGTSKKLKIVSVVNNPSNRNYSRMQIITKGAIIETEAGKARVTSRPGQTGIVNAVLIKE